MPGGLCHRITRRRLRSELIALRAARRLGPLALLPVAKNQNLWWILSALPLAIPLSAYILMIQPGEPDLQPLGWLIFVPTHLFAVALICIATWRMFRWYAIAIALTFRRPAMADRKEAELIAALATKPPARAD